MRDPFLAFFGAALAVQLLELLLYYATPQLLARVAFVPIGEAKRVDIHDALGRRLRRTNAKAGYRDPAAYPADASDIPLPEAVEGETYVFRPVEGAGMGFVRLKMGAFIRRTLGIARIQASLEGHQIVLRARFSPVPLVGPVLVMAAMVWLMWHERFLPFAVGVVLFVIALTFGFTYWRLREPVSEVMSLFAAHLATHRD